MHPTATRPGRLSGFLDVLLGRPLASDEDGQQKIGPATGISLFGLDALGSAAYGPEAALTILISLGVASVSYIVPIGFSVILLLAIVCFSYLQTIPEYPQGGGSYTVARQNLGESWGLLAGSALMIDYVLTVVVGISAGVGAFVSAVPSLQPRSLELCFVLLAVVTTVNLRGVRESGAVFIAPTYLFIGSMLSVLGLGVWKSLAAGGHPVPVIPPHPLGPAHAAASAWLLLRAFSSGCTAMTGVEAVSNGVMAFKEPRTKSASQTLILIVGILILMLAGIAVLCRAYRIGATVPGQSGYESVLSQLTAAVIGKGPFYYVTIGAVVAVLALQANTAFADFPRLCRAIALDGYLPRFFVNRGRRLVYTHGIVVLAVLAAILLAAFGGITDHLIPLFAVGAFLAFTLSQAGMVMHWRKAGGRRISKAVNAVGAAATAGTLLVVIVSKFTEGAWITLLMIPGILILLRRVRRHYECEEREVANARQLSLDAICPPLVVVPIESWTRISERALRFALSISHTVLAVHVKTENTTSELEQKWAEWVEDPARCRGVAPPRLVVLSSPYRFVIQPILDYVLTLEREHSDRQLAVIVPNLVEHRWYQRFLHNQRGELLTALLLLNGNKRISIVNVPWYLENDSANF
jgi:amino acid transporter